MSEEEDGNLWVAFAGDPVADWYPMMAVGPNTLKEAVVLRGKDGRRFPMPTPGGVKTMRIRWVACVDHKPSNEEIAALAEGAYPDE